MGPASRTALEEHWPGDPAGLSSTSVPTLASEQHRCRPCLDPETGRPWAGDPDLCTVPLSQQRLCPDPGACQGDGRGGGHRGRGLESGGVGPGQVGLGRVVHVSVPAVSWPARPPASPQGLLDLRLEGQQLEGEEGGSAGGRRQALGPTSASSPQIYASGVLGGPGAAARYPAVGGSSCAGGGCQGPWAQTESCNMGPCPGSRLQHRRRGQGYGT